MLAGLAGCPSYTFLEVLPERVTENQITVKPGERVPADILFVVDNSCSMEDEQELLAQNFGAFIELVAGAKADFRLAVVTTSLKDTGTVTGEVAGITSSQHSMVEPFQWLIQSTSRSCTATGIAHGCFRGSDANRRVVTSQMSREQQISSFQDNVRVGSCGSGDEEGLSGMTAALRSMAPGGCNDGFLRPEANLVIVIVSDEEDQSRERDLDVILAELAALKPLERVRFGAIVGAEQGPDGARATRCRRGGPTCGSLCETYGPVRGSQVSCNSNVDCNNGEVCQDGARRCVEPEFQYWQNCDWCTYYNAPDCCSALSGSRYVDFAKRLEARIVQENAELNVTGCRLENPDGLRVACLIDSICQESFSDTLRRIATDLVIRNFVRLDPKASYPPGVVVKVNGEEWVNGVDYEVSPTGEELQYTGRSPDPDDLVEVFYTLPE